MENVSCHIISNMLTVSCELFTFIIIIIILFVWFKKTETFQYYTHCYRTDRLKVHALLASLEIFGQFT